MKKYYLSLFTFCAGISLLLSQPVRSELFTGSDDTSAIIDSKGMFAEGASSIKKGTFFPADDSDSISVPNIITPNGDGINDVLTIYCKGVNSFSIEIFDRWGQEVFTSAYPEITWDGRTNAGVKVSDGVYFYVVKAYSVSGKDMSCKGFITVLGSGVNGN